MRQGVVLEVARRAGAAALCVVCAGAFAGCSIAGDMRGVVLGGSAAEIVPPQASDITLYGVGGVVSHEDAVESFDRELYGADHGPRVDVDLRLVSVTAASHLPDGVSVEDCLYIPDSSSDGLDPASVDEEGNVPDGWVFLTVTLDACLPSDVQAGKVRLNDMKVYAFSEGSFELTAPGEESVWKGGAQVEDDPETYMFTLYPGEWTPCTLGYFVPRIWMEDGCILLVNRDIVGLESKNMEAFDLTSVVEWL